MTPSLPFLRPFAALVARRSALPCAAFALAALAAPAALAQSAPSADIQRDKLAQTTMKFLSLSMDPRAAALADAVTAVEGMPTALFYNPASMARQAGGVRINLAQTQWIADFNHNAVSGTFAPARGRYGVIGASMQVVDYGDIIETVTSNNAQGYDELGTFRPTALAVGLGYAKDLSDRFAVGGQVKYASIDLGNPVRERASDGALERDEVQESVFAYDFGMLYRTGYKSLNFAVSARNFSPDVTYVRESTQLPLSVRIGVAMDLVDLTRLDQSVHQLNASVDALNSRDYPEQIKAGLEYGFMNTVFLRGGVTTRGGEQGISAGLGVQKTLRSGLGFGADYAYTDMGVFNDFGRVHRLGLRFAF